MSWKKIRLGDSATFINGYPFKPTEWNTVGKPIIRIQDLTGNAYESNYFNGSIPSKYLVKNGDILISWSASLGVYEWDKEDAWLNQHIFKVVLDKSEVDKRFFKYLLQEKVEEMKSAVHGATMKHITKGRFDSIEIKIPDLPTQKHIASILDKADALRQQNRQLLNYYDELLQSTFIEMFGDPGTNLKKWKKDKLRNYVKIVGGGTPSREVEEYFRGDICWATAKDIKKPYLLDTQEHITEKAIKNSATKLVNAGSILIVVKSKILMHTLPLTISKVPVTFGQDLKAIIPTVELEVLFLARQLKILERKLLAQARGANTEGLNLDHLNNLEVCLPPIKIQQQFGSVVKVIEQEREQTSLLLKESQHLFNSLLTEYFN